MLFKDLIDYFNISGDFPSYILDESFNEIFLDGNLSKVGNCHEIIVKTRQNVIHKMIIDSVSDYPVIIISKLPNGMLNGMKFGQTKGDIIVIDKLY